MALTKEEVLKVAHLARLEFEEERIESFQTELNSILTFVDKLQELNTEGIEPLTQVNHQVNNLRKDEIKESLNRDKVLKNAPQKDEGMFIVPKVVGEN